MQIVASECFAHILFKSTVYFWPCFLLISKAIISTENTSKVVCPKTDVEVNDVHPCMDLSPLVYFFHNRLWNLSLIQILCEIMIKAKFQDTLLCVGSRSRCFISYLNINDVTASDLFKLWPQSVVGRCWARF